MNNRLWINLAAIVCLLIGINLKGETIQITDADISRNTTWTANNQYVLNGLVFVEEGETLTIEPGTVIKGKPGQGAEASALVVARGGKIFAEGTAEAPIIFTAEADDASDPEDFGSTDRGLWGGVIVLGRATLNSPSDSGSPITDNIEGIDINETRGRFGGNDDTDNSGVLRYISIRHGGTLIGADNEINGLTLGAVGSGTTLEFIEVFANLDDGIEFFGGTASVKFASVSYCGDDSFDYDQGWRGKGQFWFTIQDGDSGDGGEHDGDIDDNTRLPIAKPTIYNATFIGGGIDSGNGKRAFHIRDNAGAEYYNSIFTDFNGRAVDVADDSLARAQAGDVDFRNNLFWAFGAGDSATTIANANATFLFTETDRLNQIADPKLTGISRDYDEVLDPRPMAESPALSNALFPVNDAFFTNVGFQGAFGAENWAAQWTALATGGYMKNEGFGVPEGMPVDPTPSGVLQITDADISRNTTWTANNQYVLNGLVFVEEGETLTIEPGTVIKGKPGQGAEASALVVARGGKIFAEGTAEAPIIFTAEADDASDPEDFGSTDRGLWGGVIVLGRATLNSPSDSGSPITDNIEGIDINETRGRFGGNDDTDNSGVLRYISIRHGGTLIGADNEINGLTLGAVGSGTTLEFIEVFANLDDGIEFFGGTASVKFASVSYCGDDSFDYDQGWRGKGQFWFTIQDGDSGDGGEHDGDIDDNTRLPIAKPTIYNATFIGGGIDSGNGKRAFHIRDNAGAEYYNSIFTDFNGRAVDVADDSLARAQAGDVDFRNNLFWAFGAGDSATTIANANATFLFTETDRLNQIADPKLTGISRDYDEVLDPRPMAESPALSNALFPVNDAFFTNVGFQGAFGAENWAAQWTALATGGYMKNEGFGVPEGMPVTQPSISISRDGSNIVIEWEGVLQSATDPRGLWQDVADDSQSPIVLAPGDQLPSQFMRAVAP